MRPWQKRGFLNWLFFQDPGKRKSPAPRRRAIPVHPPKVSEEAAQPEAATTIAAAESEGWEESVAVYPMPPNESVIEAKIIDFIENEFETNSQYAGYTQDESIPEPMQSQDAVETVTPFEEDASVSFYAEYASEAEEMPPESSKSTIMMLLDEPDSTLFKNVLDTPDVKHVVAVEEQEEPQYSNEPPVEQPAEQLTEAPQDEGTAQDWVLEYVVGPNGENFIGTEPEEDNSDMLQEYTDFASAENQSEPINTETPQISTWEEAGAETIPEPTIADILQTPTRDDEVLTPQATAYESDTIAQHEYGLENDIMTPKASSYDTDFILPAEPYNTVTSPTISPQTVTCEKCDITYDNAENFCGGCGTPLIRSKPNIPPVNAFCGNCGAKNEHMMKFCGDCGHNLTTSQL